MIIISIIIGCFTIQSKNVFAYNNVTNYLFYDNQFYIFNSINNETKIYSVKNPNNPILSIEGRGVCAYICDNTIFCVISTGMDENIIYTSSINSHEQQTIPINDLYIDYDNTYNFTPINNYTFAYVKNNSKDIIIYDINKKSTNTIEINNGINSIMSDGEAFLVKENTRLHYINLQNLEVKKYNEFSASGKIKYLDSNVCIIGNSVYSYNIENIEFIIKIDDNAILLDDGYSFFKDNTIYITDENYNVIYSIKTDYKICSISYNGLLYVLTVDNNGNYKTINFDIYDLINKGNNNPTDNPNSNNSNFNNNSNINTSNNNSNSIIENNSSNNQSTSSQNNINNNNNIFTDNKYYIYGNYITNIPQGTTIAVLKKSINNNYQLSVINHNNKSITSGKIGTGFTLTFTNKSTNQKYVYYTIVYGDVTGEGNINSNDINTLMLYLLGEKDLSDCAKISADIDNSGNINNRDLLIISQKTA